MINYNKFFEKVRKYKNYRKQLNKKNYNTLNSSKILLISHDASKSGAPMLLDYIAREMKKQGITLYIISRSYGAMLFDFMKSGETKVIKTKRGFKRNLKKIKKLGFNKVICNTTVNGDLVPILKDLGFNVISLVHELPKTIQILKIQDRAEQIASKSNVVIFPSTYVYNKFLEIANVSVKYIIKPQGLYLTDNIEYNKEKSKSYLQEKYLIPKCKKMILNVARGEKRKGYDLFLKVTQELSTMEELIFVWVGDYDKEIYKSFLDEYNIKSAINLTQPGFINDSIELSKFYQAADLFLLTSREDPFPSVVLQAFNAYTPVVAFENAGGFCDIVKNDGTGYLVEYENLTAIKEAILKIIQSSEITKIGVNCKKVAENIRFDDYVKTLINL